MKKIAFGIFLLLILFTGVSSFGQGIRVGPNGEFSEQTLSLSYAFYKDSFGFAVEYVYGVVGRPQKQATLPATPMAGTKGSAMGFWVGRDLQMPRVERLFLDPIISVGYFKDSDAYINGHPHFPEERAGSNDSDKNNFVEGDGWDNFFRLRFKYLLPIGGGREQIITTYKIRYGLLESDATCGTSLNPLKMGLDSKICRHPLAAVRPLRGHRAGGTFMEYRNTAFRYEMVPGSGT